MTPTPKDEAKRLIELFYRTTSNFDYKGQVDARMVIAKEAALLCVEEIIKTWQPYTNMLDQDVFDGEADFYLQVKTEIENYK